MRLDNNCIREILLAIEELSDLDDRFSIIPISFDNLSKHITSYTEKEIFYALKKLYRAEFVSCSFNHYDNSVVIYSLSYKGHEFLNRFR